MTKGVWAYDKIRIRQFHNFNLAFAYSAGRFVGRNSIKAINHLETAAIGGHEVSRHMLGCIEVNRGRMDRAMKHFMIAAKSGSNESLRRRLEKGIKLGMSRKMNMQLRFVPSSVCG